MAKKQIMWKTKGMNQDMSVSAFDPEFAFENMNLRLSTNEGNTMMSWVNERGTTEITLVEYDKEEETPGYLDGVCIGTAVLNEYLVMFMSKSDPVDHDCIYRLNYNDDKTVLRVKELYKGDLNFDVNHPIETLVSYESEHIQKVYWTDHKNQPRLINIAPDNDSRIYTATSFDFVPTLELKEDVKVVKVLGGGGMFAPGVIQYAFTYYNKHGQESNIFHVTPLYYLSHKDRGASPEEKVDNTFKITVTGLDTHFDYLRIYSIQRTSIDATPICKRIQDIEIGALQADETTEEKSASYIDTGTSGNSIDPTELLYKGGSEINIGTMGQKDGTLFMGDITLLGNRQPNAEPAEGEEEPIHITTDGISIEDDTRSFYVELESSDNYVYGNQLNAVNAYPTGGVSVPCSGFKHGDWYRCGIQLQDSLGRWTDPIFLDDIQIGNFPSITNQSGGGGEHSDEDLELVVRFINASGKYITMQNEITVGIEPVSVNSTRAAQEPIELTIELDMPETMQFAPGSNELISGVISQGRQYTGSMFVALEGQETPASVKDADGNPTHAVTIASWEHVKTVLGTSLEVICTSTTNPDDVPVPVPPEPPTPPTPTDFSELLSNFNALLNKKVSEGSVTYNYLLNNYNTAEDEWNNNTLGLFNIIDSSEIYDYRGDGKDYYDTAHTAMQAWLMAMCLSELVPTTGTTTNRQTRLFQKAFELGEGSTVPIYGNYTVKSDVIAARLVAGAVYAYIHDTYTNQMSTMRAELEGSSIDASDWIGLGYNNEAGEPGNSDSPMTSLGYLVNTDLFLPGSPGPFANGFNEGYFTGQDQNLFYGSSEEITWYRYNYRVDVDIDNYITQNYRLYTQGLDGYYLKAPSNAAEKEKNLRILESATIPTSSDFVYFGKKRVKYTGNVTPKRTIDGITVTNFIFEETSDEITDTNNVYDIAGPFASLQNVVFNGTMPVIGEDGVTYNLYKRTAHMEFLSKIMDIADNCRFPTMQRMWGRRRPLGGDINKTARNNNIQEDPLNGLSNASLECICARYGDDIAKWSNPETADDFPHDSAKSYPSGHSVQAWTLAMYLSQIQPEKLPEYMAKAYRFSVNRSIGRFHWNSDCMYGRLFGTMILPIINAMDGIQDSYTRLKNAIRGGLSDDITISLTINNRSGYDARFTGEIYFYLVDKTGIDYDNTGKHYTDGGIVLSGFTDWNVNKISIPNGSSSTFQIIFPASTINRLSNVLASEAICQHNYNVVLYSKGTTTDYSGPISAAYICGFMDGNNNTQVLVDGSSHYVDLVGVDPGVAGGNITIDPIA